jgi:F0F1-type ATP synthase delta subunit
MATKVVHAENLTEEQQNRLKKALKDASDSHLRAEAEAEYLREVIKKIAEDLKIPKKLVNALAKTYHKNNFDEVVAEHEAFEKMYKTVVK